MTIWLQCTVRLGIVWKVGSQWRSYKWYKWAPTTSDAGLKYGICGRYKWTVLLQEGQSWRFREAQQKWFHTLRCWQSFSTSERAQVTYKTRPPDFTKAAAHRKSSCKVSVKNCRFWRENIRAWRRAHKPSSGFLCRCQPIAGSAPCATSIPGGTWRVEASWFLMLIFDQWSVKVQDFGGWGFVVSTEPAPKKHRDMSWNIVPKIHLYRHRKVLTFSFLI